MRKLLIWLTKPKQKDKDLRRREFILYILLLGIIFLSTFATFASWLHSFLIYTPIRRESIQNTIFTSLFYLLFIIAKKGNQKLASYGLIFFSLFVTLYSSYIWGASIPEFLIVYSLVIVMAGILINSRFAFIITGIISVLIIVLVYLQSTNILSSSTNWTIEAPTVQNAFVFSITFFIIALVSWLFNKEGEKALRRAQISERELRRHNEHLEEIIEERTRQLHLVEAEKMAQIYRFAEFGRITSGMFHDLGNPLTVLSLNLHSLKRKSKSIKSQQLQEFEEVLFKATHAAKQLEEFVISAKRQLQHEHISETFSVGDEIRQVITMLEYKATGSGVKITFTPTRDIHTVGNRIKFNQIILNLLSNAIDSYDGAKTKDKRVIITLVKKRNIISVTIQDFGKGIARENLPNIFLPLFTTKKGSKGTGLGLAICKDIVEKDFQGRCFVESSLGRGTVFTVRFKQRKMP